MSRSPYDEPPGFWTFFFAVLAALIAHDVLRLLVAAAGISLAVGAFKDAVPAGTTPGHLPARPGQMERSVEPAPLPRWPGPVKAYREGSSRACINGRVADFVRNGWKQNYQQRCVASSE